MRIAYDVTPLSHPRTGVGNYILGALRGMLEAPGPEREIVAFGPASIRGRGLLDETLDGLPVEKRFFTVPFAHATRRAWGALGRPPAERFLGDFDVMHFTDWMVPPQRSGVRATMIHDLGPLRFPEKLHPRTVSMHSATAREAANCDVVFTNSSYTANDVIERLGLPLERVHVAYPGVDDRFRPHGERHDHGRPYVFTTATEDWRKNRSVVELAVRLLGDELALVALGHEGLGYPADDELAGALPRCRGVRVPLAVRGFRHAGHRGDGLRRPVRRVFAPVARRGVRRRGGARRSRTAPRSSRRESAEPSPIATSS